MILRMLPNYRAASAKTGSIENAMFDRGPGTTWLQQNGLLDQGIPYPIDVWR